MQTIEIYDIYDIWYEPAWWQTKTCWLLLALFFLCGIVWVLYRFIEKKRQQRNARPDVKALKQLQELQYRLTTIHPPLLYSMLTELLKQYLCQRYGWRLMSRTDKELLNYIKRKELSSEIIGDLSIIFSGVEHINFAHQEVVLSKMSDDLARSIQLVKKLC